MKQHAHYRINVCYTQRYWRTHFFFLSRSMDLKMPSMSISRSLYSLFTSLFTWQGRKMDSGHAVVHRGCQVRALRSLTSVRTCREGKGTRVMQWSTKDVRLGRYGPLLTVSTCNTWQGRKRDSGHAVIHRGCQVRNKRHSFLESLPCFQSVALPPSQWCLCWSW